MIALVLAAQVVGSVGFDPPLVFAGEPVSVLFDPLVASRLRVSDAQNVEFGPRVGSARLPGARRLIVLKPQPASFWVLLEGSGAQNRPPKAPAAESAQSALPVDAKLVHVPAALVSRWRAWPPKSGVSGGAAFFIGEKRSLAAVPMEANYGLCILESGSETRYADIVVLDVAVRSGPGRVRAFKPDYVYAGPSGLTLLARPDNVARIAVRLSETTAELALVAGYEMSGFVELLGKRRQIQLQKAETLHMTVAFDDLRTE